MASSELEKDTRALEDPEKAGESTQVEQGPTALGLSDEGFRRVEKSALRKLDFTLVPLVMGMYLLAFLDRSNIGNANVAGMSKNLKIDDGQYQWLLTIFYISYILFEFQALMWKLIPPHIWGAFCVFFWGLMSTCLAAIKGWSGAMALRFFMGVFEAGYGPGVPYLLSFFYLRHEIGLRIGFFLAAAPLANTFAGALAYGITSNRNPSIENWRVLFLVEGLPTIIMAPVVYFLLPDSPQKSIFLNAEEKKVTEARGVRQAGTAERIGHVNVKEIFAALSDVKAWLTAFMYFSCNVSFSSLPVFLPTILNQMGFTAVNAQGLTAPPFFLSFLLTIATTYLADRTQQRGLTIALLTSIGGAGYLMLALARSTAARYAGAFLAAAGIFPAIANILPWVLNNQGSDTRRGSSIILLNLIGQCGPLLGTRLYPEHEKPFFVKGQSVCAAFMFFTTLLVLALRALLVWENKKLDQKYGTVEEQKARRATEGEKGNAASDGIENYGPMYRYVL